MRPPTPVTIKVMTDERESKRKETRTSRSGTAIQEKRGSVTRVRSGRVVSVQNPQRAIKNEAVGKRHPTKAGRMDLPWTPLRAHPSAMAALIKKPASGNAGIRLR